MKNKAVTGSKLLLLIGILISSHFLLENDAVVFLKWWAALAVLGIGFFPLTGRLFSMFRDGGWVVSKVLGIAGSGFLTWLLVCCKLTVFTTPVCVGITIVAVVLIWSFCLGRTFFGKNKGKNRKYKCELNAILDGELIFTVFFLVWTYVAGFRPAAYGTEKFMDYGHDAGQNTSCKGSLVCKGDVELLLRWSVFCGISDKAYENPGGADLQSYAYHGGGICLCTSVYIGSSDDT